ncbi:MAG: GLPGLI family protein [Chitinophagaceae bacterium]
MRYSILFSTAIILFTFKAIAQQPSVAQIVVHYKFSHVRDTTHRDKPYTDNTVLLIGKGQSVYRRYDQNLQQALAGQNTKQPIAKISGNGPSGFAYFQFFREKQLTRIEPILANLFLLKEALPSMDWKIMPDTATISGFRCQMATTHFKGRDYTALFCPDLPMPVGPWKLNGLPGVIIEAYDSRKEVSFIFDGIEKIAAAAEKANQPALNDPTVIRVPTNATPTSEKEFAKLQETFRKDPDAFMRLMSGPQGATGGPKMDIKPGPAPVINNPIELPDHK